MQMVEKKLGDGRLNLTVTGLPATICCCPLATFVAIIIIGIKRNIKRNNLKEKMQLSAVAPLATFAAIIIIVILIKSFKKDKIGEMLKKH